jgi:hypothetical protein
MLADLEQVIRGALPRRPRFLDLRGEWAWSARAAQVAEVAEATKATLIDAVSGAGPTVFIFV